MDVPRPSQKRKRLLRRLAYGLLFLVVAAAMTRLLSRLEPAAPSVDRASVWVDTVRLGPMVIQVRGTGILVPEEVRWIPARTQGRVEKVVLHPGAPVNAESVLIVLSNPELERELLEAELRLKAAQSQFENLQVQLESQLLNQRAAAASVQADYHQARLQADLDEQLAREGLISDLNLQLSRVRSQELETRHHLEQQRLQISARSIAAQLEVQQAETDQLRSLYQLRRKQVDDLKVRAGFTGVVQQIPVEEGQQVTAGTNLARVSVPGRLKAEIRIPETQARDIQVGQKASVDTRTDLIAGSVTRIDPAAQGGTVTVDVRLQDPLPKSALPDLTVDGIVELARLDEVLHVGRPAYGQAHATVGLFKLVDGGQQAVRVPVRLGRSSVTTVEIVSGLEAGDSVILSDTTQWDDRDRIRLR